jgi:hypothetical protein
MSFEAFMEDPKAYASTHELFIGNSLNAGGSVAAQPLAVNPAGGHSLQFRRAGPNITMVDMQGRTSSTVGAIARGIGVAPRVRRDFVVAASGVDVGLRFLPYRQGHVTYMSIDAMGTFFITGPLTGCTVAVARLAGRLWTFHSFAPVGIHGVAARLTQRQMVNHLAAGLAGAAVPVVHFAENTLQYTGQGFVLGRRRPAGNWKFYAYGSASGMQRICDL